MEDAVTRRHGDAERGEMRNVETRMSKIRPGLPPTAGRLMATVGGAVDPYDQGIREFGTGTELGTGTGTRNGELGTG